MRAKPRQDQPAPTTRPAHGWVTMRAVFAVALALALAVIGLTALAARGATPTQSTASE